MSAITAKASRKMKKYAVLTREPRCFLGSFDFSWEQRKLGDIGKARSGVGFPDADQGGVTGVPFFKVSDMNLDGNENEMIVANNYVTAEQIADHRWSPITELPAIFFAKVGAAVMLNRKRLCRFPFLLDNNTMAYSLSPTKWDADFAKALFGTVDLTSLVQVGALPSYNAGDVESMGIYLPSLFEQEQIGAFFKLLDNLITLHQRKCANLCSPSQVVFYLLFVTSTFSWEQRKAIDIADYSKGNGYSKGDLTDAGTPIILYGRLYTKYQFAISEVDTFAFPRNGAVYSQGNEVIVPASGETAEDIARASAVEKSGVLLGGDLNILRPFDFINPLFLALAISNGEPQKELAKKAQGKSVVHIHNTDIQEVTIAYPSRTEQDRIVSVFRQLDNLITLHQRECISFTGRADRLILTANKKRTTSSWEQRKVSDLAEKTYGGGTPTTSNEAYWNGDIPWIQSSDVVDGKLLGVEPRKWITQDGLNNSAAQLIPGNSIAIITRVGVGKLAFMPYSYATSQDFLSLSKLNAEPLFTVYACYKKLQSELNAVQGTSIKGITKDELLAKNIMVPRYAEQQQIGAFFKQLDNLITLHQRKPFLMKWRTSDANRNQTNRLVL